MTSKTEDDGKYSIQVLVLKELKIFCEGTYLELNLKSKQTNNPNNQNHQNN